MVGSVSVRGSAREEAPKARGLLYALQNILYGKRDAVPLRTTSCSRGCSADLFQSHLLGHKLTHARYQAPTCQGHAILGQRVHVNATTQGARAGNATASAPVPCERLPSP